MAVTPEMEQMLTQVLNKAAEVYGLQPQTEVSVVLADDEYIHQLNRQYRQKDSPTDVLSFAMNDQCAGDQEPEIAETPEDIEILLGDIVISLETASRQAQEFGHSLERELAYLTVHGMLHLLGYDHEAEKDRTEMRQEEEYILSLLGITREQ
ncbi:rRNA maturation RNase YbeY [Sporomusa acidovorans]|uniref:Endoribonuclease YbeY n=1 Tax=Sporomusa acidovorans (strain ATCC 49682 / DSM 3132 / Mol) TaxID=1123286 RepID=A0ABZ3J3R4_SPOA4|nr:rRNA maturation RNase YbeY [Sporomusa acidovorans]OZC23128.1 endoribonuclease YbeY [Sporomusa acidovorans DSM 3132]SDF06229.1 probable rRNA maturation factor [Sporomusa acidovorans]